MADTAAPAKPAHGGSCPICNVGVLFLIAETADGEYLRCFNCETSGTIHKTEAWVQSVDPTSHSPSGFTITHDQLAAKQAIDTEQATSRARAAAAAPAAAPPAAEPAPPHETHDVVPPAGDGPPDTAVGNA